MHEEVLIIKTPSSYVNRSQLDEICLSEWCLQRRSWQKLSKGPLILFCEARVSNLMKTLKAEENANEKMLSTRNTTRTTIPSVFPPIDVVIFNTSASFHFRMANRRFEKCREWKPKFEKLSSNVVNVS